MVKMAETAAAPETQGLTCSHDGCNNTGSDGGRIIYQTLSSVLRHEKQARWHPCIEGNECVTCKKHVGNIKGQYVPAVFPCRHNNRCSRQYTKRAARDYHELHDGGFSIYVLLLLLIVRLVHTSCGTCKRCTASTKSEDRRGHKRAREEAAKQQVLFDATTISNTKEKLAGMI